MSKKKLFLRHAYRGPKCLFFACRGWVRRDHPTACTVAALFGRFAAWGRTDILGSES
jgi:hypothetical protein